MEWIIKNYLFVFAFAVMPLSACGYSVMDAAEDISGSDNGLANGSKIGNSVEEFVNHVMKEEIASDGEEPSLQPHES